MLRDPAVELFTRTLGVVEPWHVEKVEFSHEKSRLDVYLNFREGAKFRCAQCGAENCDVYDTKERTWRHLNCFQYATYLHARVPRVWCHACTRTRGSGVKIVEVAWARLGARFSVFFESYVLTLAREMPVLAVSRIVGESDDRIWTIVRHYIDEARPMLTSRTPPSWPLMKRLRPEDTTTSPSLRTASVRRCFSLHQGREVRRSRNSKRTSNSTTGIPSTSR